MTKAPAPFDRLVSEADSLQRSHPHASALDVLDLVMQGHSISPSIDASAPWIAPSSPLGQLIAAALDPGMTPADWKVFTADHNAPRLIQTALEIWATEVIPRFVDRYGKSTGEAAVAR